MNLLNYLADRMRVISRELVDAGAHKNVDAKTVWGWLLFQLGFAMLSGPEESKIWPID
ncbi:hypothetical protein [Paraburkholderia humisilvae]|uniref:Uncharacterized protein n=1 Tax=Paraburkholderia humisilvae TaxID=627669 RepID=A0A6J5FBP3_9BURK|nr:hypothetical protein [Paraburkholderia humisilvae]CAB3774635.1 hypothetical protein LMG29542_08013 [Paraburkholderia humisilvae]